MVDSHQSSASTSTGLANHREVAPGCTCGHHLASSGARNYSTLPHQGNGTGKNGGRCASDPAYGSLMRPSTGTGRTEQMYGILKAPSSSSGAAGDQTAIKSVNKKPEQNGHDLALGSVASSERNGAVTSSQVGTTSRQTSANQREAGYSSQQSSTGTSLPVSRMNSASSGRAREGLDEADSSTAAVPRVERAVSENGKQIVEPPSYDTVMQRSSSSSATEPLSALVQQVPSRDCLQEFSTC